MCNRYVTPDEGEIETFWHIGSRNQPRWWEAFVHPRASGPFVRTRDSEREFVVGQWALIPHFAKSAKLPFRQITRAQRNWQPKQAIASLGCVANAASFRPDHSTSLAGRLAATCGGDFGGQMVTHGALPGYGIPGPIRQRAKFWKATQCSRSAPTRIR